MSGSGADPSRFDPAPTPRHIGELDSCWRVRVSHAEGAAWGPIVVALDEGEARDRAATLFPGSDIGEATRLHEATGRPHAYGSIAFRSAA